MSSAGERPGGNDEPVCGNCLHSHGPLNACALGVLAGVLQERSTGRVLGPADVANIDADAFWERFGGPAVDWIEGQIKERCPGCGSVNICRATPSDTRKPWGCLSCDLEFEQPTTLEPHEIPAAADPGRTAFERNHI